MIRTDLLGKNVTVRANGAEGWVLAVDVWGRLLVRFGTLDTLQTTWLHLEELQTEGDDFLVEIEQAIVSDK